MIRVEGLEKRFGDVVAVDDATFEVGRGEVVGFLGPNGAGKSTTMRCLTGVLRPDGGRATVAGVDVAGWDPAARAALGYLPESNPLDRRMRVDEYLDWVGRLRGLDRRARRSAFARVVDDCDLGEHARRSIDALSKGYRQRVGLAQALLADPDALILDEPTSGLDPGERARIRALVARLGETKTILLSTHVMAEVEAVCERVILIARGRVVADGRVAELAAEDAAGVELVVAATSGVSEALEALPEIEAVRALGVDAAGRAGYALACSDPDVAAAAAARVAAENGWDLFELRPERPSLERVFLARTEGEL